MGTTDARHALLARLIDHAPTFPPASLSPSEALREDERAAASPHAFMLARLVWPAARLAELPDLGRGVSAVVEPGGTVLDAIDAAECRWQGTLDGLDDLAPEVYVELPTADGLEKRLDQLAEHGLRAKVRCGGVAVPSARDLAGFVRACRQRALVFKATAGLHHAVRTNGEHGFLNLLAAAAFDGDEEAALAETDAEAFRLDAESFSWRDRTASPDEIVRVRRGLFHSIGSCSFFEPVEELEQLGVLPL
jgi:hypothetical protein